MKKYKEFYVPGAVVLGSLIISVSILSLGGVMPSMEGVRSATTGSTVSNNGSTVDFTITRDDHVRGNPSAKVTLVEFSDFECPFCRQFHPTVQQALAEYGDSIRWVYKHFPLDAIHPQARPAAEASECVWEQKGDAEFWAFADAMFAQQERLGSAFYREIAGNLGVNLSQFDTCVSTRKYQDKVENDYQQGIEAGVNGTPGSFVNGVPVRGAIPYDENSPGYRPGQPTLKAVIEAQL